jgi:hemerythrin-like domain-containing protein
MEATKILMEEHRVIERVLGALETAARNLRDGDPVSPAIFIQAAEFIKGFADGCHHKKEEGVLFPAMQSAGVPGEGGPIGVMLADHQEARQLTSAMRVAAERLASGDADARAELIHSALQYVDLLRQHIAKEDNVLFPMANQVLQRSAQSEVLEAFERVEHEDTGEGVHERFLELAATIEKEVAE